MYFLDDSHYKSYVDEVPLYFEGVETEYEPLQNDTGNNEGVTNEGGDTDTEMDLVTDYDALSTGYKINDNDDTPVDCDLPISPSSVYPTDGIN